VSARLTSIHTLNIVGHSQIEKMDSTKKRFQCKKESRSKISDVVPTIFSSLETPSLKGSHTTPYFAKKFFAFKIETHHLAL